MFLLYVSMKSFQNHDQTKLQTKASNKGKFDSDWLSFLPFCHVFVSCFLGKVIGFLGGGFSVKH